MKIILLISFLFFRVISFSQDSPPPMLMPSEENKKLIVELVKVTDYENYFVEYCTKHIEKSGVEKGLSKEKILKSKNRINFVEFLEYTVFNQFAVYSSEELREMIALCKKLKKKNHSNVFFTSGDLQSNLELQVETYLSVE